MSTQQSKQNQIITGNDFFNQNLSSYDPTPIPNEYTPTIPPEVEAEVLPDEFIAQAGLTEKELDQNIAICREFEGEE